ncbi:hypothetical protein V6N11_077156 [Hibiscus sabdariffa]|uniref:Uncharacterized protein n=1 Tax=Hibiscus sabdariffa TaxID=183260 RepID=A0ABR2TCP8_9ROSI
MGLEQLSPVLGAGLGLGEGPMATGSIGPSWVSPLMVMGSSATWFGSDHLPGCPVRWLGCGSLEVRAVVRWDFSLVPSPVAMGSVNGGLWLLWALGENGDERTLGSGLMQGMDSCDGGLVN